MIESIALEPVDAVTVTTLVDNVSDILLVDEGPAKRPPLALAAHGVVLRAEHGFSALVTIEKAGRTTRVLFDTGITPDGLVENMRRLEIRAGDIDIIVLSHGHWDHTTGMQGFVRELGRANVPVLIHPEFWTRRGWQPDPLILDDQALVASVRGRGLVVVTGCGHSGIVNILRYVRKLTGEDRIHAVVGGFHLSGPFFEKVIASTCDALGEFAPDHLVPSHCTGWKATHALAARFPEAFIQNSVGTRFEFT